MSYSAGYNFTMPPMLSAFSPWFSPYINEEFTASAPSSATWESANRIVYQWISIPATFVVRRVWWANGATVSGGATIEVGVYNSTGGAPAPSSLLVSGSAVQSGSGANALQFVDVTDTVLTPGNYAIAITSSATTSTTLFRSSLQGHWSKSMRMQEAGSGGLPSTATPAAGSGTALWLCGLASRAA